MGLTDDVQAGQLAGLKALRDLLAARLESGETPPHATAPLARQLQAVLRELEVLEPAPRPPDRVDLLRAQREMRRAAARAGADAS